MSPANTVPDDDFVRNNAGNRFVSNVETVEWTEQEEMAWTIRVEAERARRAAVCVVPSSVASTDAVELPALSYEGSR